MKTREMYRIVRPLALAGLLAVAGCERGATEPQEPLDALPRSLTAAEQEVIAGSNDFAWKLFRELAAERPDSNVFASPLSASMALGMTMNGARGATLDSTQATLGFGGLTTGEVNRSYRGLIDLLRGLDSRTDMAIANSIWYRQDHLFEQAFFDTTGAYFDAEVRGIDFAGPGAPKAINNWVSRSTRGKIPSIVQTIDPGTVMYLINAIYFKGAWQQRFDPAATRDDQFITAAGARAPVKMMNRTGRYRYAQDNGYQAVELPYGNGAFVMTVVLPEPGAHVDTLVSSLDAEGWAVLLNGLVETEVELQLPRFRLEYKSSLKDALRALGMGIAFDGEADFTGMSRAGGLYIEEVLQKSYVDVNEEGTEAAAVTSVEMRVVSMPAHPVMRVDRPFLVAIRERFSGTLLFVGRIAAPAT